MMKKYLFVGMAFLFVLSCSPKKVKRVSPEEQIDLSGRWNDTDSRLVSEAMIKDCLNHPWLPQFMREEGKKPVVIVGEVRNKTTEHIAVNTFIKDLERALINSGEVRVVANAAERLGVRSEREEQLDWASPETRKRLRNELGADYMLIGSIESIEDREGNKRVIFYQVNLELVDIETNEKVWIGEKKIKKYIKRSFLGF
jgi:hypothetical protein